MSLISKLAKKYGTPDQIDKYSKSEEPAQFIPCTKKKEELPIDQERFFAHFIKTAQQVIGKDYVLGSEKNAKRIKSLVQLFNSSEPINKFIVLSGLHGSGKTTIMIALGRMLHGRPQGFGMRHSNKIIENVKEGDYQAIKHLESGRLCINDYGYNDKAIKRYGNEIDALDLLIYNRWETRGLATFFTTNYQSKEEFLRSLSLRTRERVAPEMIFVPFNETNHRI